jgi:hypothetical protein
VVVAGVSSPACVVHSFAVDSFQLTTLNPTTALLTYHALNRRCVAARSAESGMGQLLYVRRGGAGSTRCTSRPRHFHDKS